MAKRPARKKKSEIDSRLVALGAAAAGGIAGGAIARSRVKKPAITKAERVRMAKQAIRSVPTYGRDMRDYADAVRMVRSGKESLKQADDALFSNLKSSRFTPSNSAGILERELRSKKAVSLNQIEAGKYNAITAGSKMAKNREVVSALMNDSATARRRANTAAYKSKATRAMKGGAIKGAAGAATVAMIVQAVLKELNKK